MDKPLKLFSVGWDDSIGADREFIVAHDVWEAFDYFKSKQPGEHYPFDISLKQHTQWERVLVTDGYDVTRPTSVKDLLAFAESRFRNFPAYVGKQNGMQLFVVDGKYGIVAHSQPHMLWYYKSMATKEAYMDLLWRINEQAHEREYEPGIEIWTAAFDPVKYIDASEVITIVGPYGPLTATAEQHMRQAIENGAEMGRLLFIQEEDGTMREPSEEVAA